MRSLVYKLRILVQRRKYIKISEVNIYSMDAINTTILVIILILIAIVIVVLRRELRVGNNRFNKLKVKGSMTSSGCFYHTETDEVEIAPKYGGVKLKMMTLDADAIEERKCGGVYLIYLCQNRHNISDNTPNGPMISVNPITMEVARKIMDITWESGTFGALNVYTHEQRHALSLAKGNKDITPVLHSQGRYGLEHYHRYFIEGGEGFEKSPRAFFGELKIE